MSKLGSSDVSLNTHAQDIIQEVGGQVDSIVAGTNIDSIDNTDPANPIINAAASGGGTRIISDTTLGAAAQTITVSGLANITEFDFELHVPNAATVVNVQAYINGNTTATDYRTQSLRSFNVTVQGQEFDDSHMGFIRTAGPTLFIGQVRLVDSHFTLYVKSMGHETSAQDNLKYATAYKETTDTDFTQISFDTLSGTNLLPTGTRLVLLNPYA